MILIIFFDYGRISLVLRGIIMNYYDSLDKKKYDELGRRFAVFQPYPLDSYQLKHSEIVADEIITNYSERIMIDDNDISFKELVSGAKKIFSPEGIGFVYVGGAASSLLSSVKYKKRMSIHDFDFLTLSDTAFDGLHYYKIPNSLVVPGYFTLSSVHLLVHETCHMLKELNFLECKGIYSDEEVIPIALELISAFENRDFDVFKKREYLMQDTADLYVKLTNDKSNIAKEDMLGFNSCYRKCIMYLNSFYYAMKLFSRYLEDKETTLEYIEMVLLGESTTKRLLDVLFVEDDLAYEIGLSEFRSKLR